MQEPVPFIVLHPYFIFIALTHVDVLFRNPILILSPICVIHGMMVSADVMLGIYS